MYVSLCVFSSPVLSCLVLSSAGENNDNNDGRMMLAVQPATLEGGAVINVPLFIKIGEKIRVDTEGKKYMNRANE